MAFTPDRIDEGFLERCPKLKTTNPNLTLKRLIAEEETRLVTILPKLPASKERRVLHTLPAALGESSTHMLTAL